MLGRLLPRETRFFDLFEEHAELTARGARELARLVGGEDDADTLIRQINELETAADQVTHRCVEALHRTFITPIEREDIHRLISRMDDVLDNIEEAAECLRLYKIAAPTAAARGLCAVLVEATQAVQKVVGLMRRLDDAEAVSRVCFEIQRLEHEGDALYRNAVAALFEHEADLRTLIKWKEIYENIESAIDRCQDVANVIEGVLLEQS